VTAWLPDVVRDGVIASSWGNTIRDRTVTPFATAADRDAAIPVPKNGMMCMTVDNGTVWVYRALAWRVLYHPSLVEHHAALALSGITNTAYVLGMTPAPPAAPFPTTQYLRMIGTAYGNGNANQFQYEFRTTAGVGIAPAGWIMKLAGPLSGGDYQAIVCHASRTLAASADPSYQFVYSVNTQNASFNIDCVSQLVPAAAVL